MLDAPGAPCLNGTTPATIKATFYVTNTYASQENGF
jgi:hypothetical protein